MNWYYPREEQDMEICQKRIIISLKGQLIKWKWVRIWFHANIMSTQLITFFCYRNERDGLENTQVGR